MRTATATGRVVLSVMVASAASVLLAGPRWAPVNSPTKATLRAVWFVDSSRVLAVGDQGTILKSDDGGLTWAAVSSPSKGSLRAIHFADPKHGWICGDGDPDAPSPRGHVVSGRPMKCGTCLITRDGGEKWERVWVQTNFELRAIWMASAEIGQICNHGTASHADGDRVLTRNGGQSWRMERVYRGLNDCCWVDEKEGWAVGSRVSVGFWPEPKTPLYSRGAARIVHTADGGATWTVQSSPDIGSRDELRSVHFVNAKFGCAVGDGGAILITANGGSEWERVGRTTEKPLYAVWLTRQDAGWAVGADGGIVETSDGGKTWKKQLSSVTETLRGVHFSEKGSGIAVGDNGVILRFTSE